MDGNKEEVSRYLLNKFMKRDRNSSENEAEDEELELSLGLSMNGRFGVDPARKKLKRSTTISNFDFCFGDCSNQPHGVAFESYAPLVRTQSLPVETAEEWRRRKEMEARKRRMEKLKNARVVKDDKENCVENERVEKEMNFNCSENGNLMRVSKVSVGLLRSGSSGTPDLQIEGLNRIPKLKSLSSLESARDEYEQNTRTAARNAKANVVINGALQNAMLDMPYVTTKGDGPNGNKIEGLLYRYKKGEEVKIVCVCHGMFLSPAEFVKHGGGGDVDQPLKHIVVNPFPLL